MRRGANACRAQMRFQRCIHTDRRAGGEDNAARKVAMKIVLAGGSGQVGTMLARTFLSAGHEVVVLSRRPARAPWRTVYWDAHTLPLGGEVWVAEINGADVVVNLAGRSVNCRYTPRNRRLIMDSRVQSVRAVGEGIGRCARPPAVWLQASTATIYSHRFDAANDDATGIIGGTEPGVPELWKFSIDVARAWERAATEVPLSGTRLVLLRSALTLSPDAGGVFDVLLRLVRLGLGGAWADGRQYVSWIHYQDFISACNWLINRTDISGPVNLAAPEPLPNEQFMRDLRRAWGTSVGLPATKMMLELGAMVMRTETELVLKSRRVAPSRLLQEGFAFTFPTWREGAIDLCRRWREQRAPARA